MSEMVYNTTNAVEQRENVFKTSTKRTRKTIKTY